MTRACRYGHQTGIHLDRLASATFEQMKTALGFLSIFSPDEFDHAMDVAQSKERAAQ